MNETLRLLDRLIAFPTVSSASNLELVSWIESEVSPLNARLRKFPNLAGDKTNLLVSIGPEEPGGIVWSGHTDVVPVEGQNWSAAPFVMRRKEGKVIGRGATDMKGFLACALAAARSLDLNTLARPLHLAFSYDEEVGCVGAHDMANWLGASDLKPQHVIVGEPTGLKLVNVHKGGMIGWAHVHGKTGHSSRPDIYVNSVMVAADLIAFISAIRSEMREGPKSPRLDPPYSTIQVNQIHGGTAGNIVPELCSFFWEMRVIPGAEPQDIFQKILAYARDVLEPAMKAVDNNCRIDIEPIATIPALRPNDDIEAERELLAQLNQAEAETKAAGTEAGIFQKAGMPTYILGPGFTAQSHQPDEFIEEVQLESCTALLKSFVQRYCCT
ncbi:acetylornithine deacetylase [Phyllobacterium sp. YR531]|uniref:acetylornithine deacetylase n=1 Tax=Phyllobacterium sp. YR531 TaxID=1144343 RepID=UPI00026FB1EC|nr:acetylornithine deacetylase [Phyllobacterium sp. YR531]EJN05821.1 acetylornithine deacetylase ArgE [Phyllobacterium sp. YR531]